MERLKCAKDVSGLIAKGIKFNCFSKKIMHYKSYWILQYSKIKKYLIKKHVDLKNTLIIEKSLCLFVF